jgi:Putative bacterial sensory transduction regulator
MAIRFESAAQEACYQKVVGWMKELFGESAHVYADSPAFASRFGTAFVYTWIRPWGDDAVVDCRAYVVSGAQLTPELARFLLDENAKLSFGAFAIDDGEIVFRHCIVGSTCDKGELEASVGAVSQTADEYDDQIVQRWGGQRALDTTR